jgi:hypothetical protein
LLVPPCWFAEKAKVHGATTDTRRDNTRTKLASDDQPRKNWRKNPVDRPYDTPKTKKRDYHTPKAKKQDYHTPKAEKQDYHTTKAEEQDYDCPLLLRLLVPPCWFASKTKARTTSADTHRVNTRAELASDNKPRKNWRDNHSDRAYNLKKKSDDCPLLLRLLVPPCWFASNAKAKATAADDDGTSGAARLTSGQEWRNDRTDDDADREQDRDEKDNDCPLLLRLLVPPCWFAN